MFFTLTSSYYTGRYVMKSDWRVYGKKADFKRLADKYSIDQVIARIIRNRDICGDSDIDMYLNGDIKDMHAPKNMKDAVVSVDIIEKKIKEKCRIRIIGDYDIDGICSIYILYKGLLAAGADVDYVVPHRINDGYGINEHLIDNALSDGIDTIITCDNGISAYSQVKKSIVYHQQMLLLILNRRHVNILLSCYVEQVLHISLYAFFMKEWE